MITKISTVVGLLWNSLWVVVAGFFLAGILLHDGAEDPPIPFLAIGLGVLYFALGTTDTILKKGFLKRRSAEIAELAALYGIQHEWQKFAYGLANFSMMSLTEMHGVRDTTYSNILIDKEWQYCDFSYSTYRKLKSGEYKAATHYYSVITTQLPRSLPNVVFDSLKQRRRQFRFHFAKSQLHHLEGDFDKHFATYFPRGYTVDSMSFISPDVMWALREAEDYDVEIVGDRLFLYGSLLGSAEAQLDDMHTKLMDIKKQLLDNILTYRDERLPMEIGRQRVSAMAMELKRSKFWKYVSIALLVLYVLIQIVPQMLASSR